MSADPVPPPRPAKIIQEGDLAKVQAVFPGKFVFIYVADRTTQVADLAGSASTAEDIRLLKTLLHRVTLGETNVPKERN